MSTGVVGTNLGLSLVKHPIAENTQAGRLVSRSAVATLGIITAQLPGRRGTGLTLLRAPDNTAERE